MVCIDCCIERKQEFCGSFVTCAAPFLQFFFFGVENERGMESLFDSSLPFKPTAFPSDPHSIANRSREASNGKLRHELVRKTMRLVSSPSTLLLTDMLVD